MKTAREFFREMLSENGVGSSKRLVGFISILVTLGCIIYLVIAEGCSTCVENLLQTVIISACALLGVSSVTSIFK
jgi:hypothetical protein